MVIKSLSISAKILSLLGIMIMLAVVSFFIWVINAPRSLSVLTPYVERELSSISPDFSVDIDESYIKWDIENKAFSIYITNVRLLGDTKQIIASFPQASFDFSVISILQGRILSSDLTLIKPSLYIDLSRKALYVTPTGDTKLQTEIIKNLSRGIAANGDNLPIKSIHIKDADIFVDNGVSEFVWKVTEGYARIYKNNGQKLLTSELNINFGKSESYFKAEIKPDANNVMDINIIFNDLPSYVAADVFPNITQLSKLNISSSGEVNFMTDADAKISQLQFAINHASGEISIPEYFPKNLVLKNLSATGSFYEDFSSLAINNLEADFNGPIISVSGKIKNHAVFPEISPELNAQAEIKNMQVNDVQNYWPIGFGEKAREWVTKNITGGNVPSAYGTFILSPDDFAHMKQWHKDVTEHPEDNHPVPLPLTAIDASVNVQETRVSYLPEYPDVKDVTAVVKFNGHSMNATIEKGKFLQSDITNGSVVIPDLWWKPIQLDIKGDFVGKVDDMAQVLAIHKDKLPKNNILESIYKSSGNDKGTVSLSFPARKGLKYSDMNLNIKANISDAILPAFINGQPFTKGNFAMNLEGMKIHASGTGNLNDADLKIDYEQNFEIGKEFDKKYMISGNVSAKYLEELNLAKIPYIDNDFYLDVMMVEKAGINTLEGSADITNSVVTLKQIAFEKPAGVIGKVNFKAIQKKPGSIDISNFKVIGDKFSGEGSMNITNSELTYLNIISAKFANNNIKGYYESNKTTLNIDIKGDTIDLSKTSLNKILKNSENREKDVNILTSFKTVQMKNGQVLKDFTSNVKCTPAVCSSVNAYAKIANDNFVVLSVKPLGDRSSLMVESDNAGAVISAFGISPNIRNGRLTIESTFAKANKNVTAKGIVRIRDFTAVKTPLLGKLFTLASLQGIQDLLNSEGITFKKFEAPFQMTGGQIAVNNAKSSGASVGITASGVIDTDGGAIDLRGAIVPAYEVNKILGNIPLVGNIIIGKEGEGILATKYRVTGPYEDAKVTVNPLTILAPGFLRNLFDILP